MKIKNEHSVLLGAKVSTNRGTGKIVAVYEDGCHMDIEAEFEDGTTWRFENGAEPGNTLKLTMAMDDILSWYEGYKQRNQSQTISP